MEETKNSFSYARLDETRQEIRLVFLAPAANFDDEIRCTIRHVSLLDHPEYEAVSYAWGDATITRKVILEGQSYQVTENLILALRHLRPKTEERVLWVDAICINQNDLEERGCQVELMARIYAQAVRDLLWVGPDLYPETTLLIKKTFEDAYMDKDIRFVERYGQMARLKSLLERERTKIWDWIIAIHIAPIWQRLWIVQEVLKARDVHIILGHEFLPWEFFIFLDDNAYEEKAGVMADSIDFWYGTSTIARLWWQKDLLGTERHTEKLKQLISIWSGFVQCRCVDPRDKLYALVNLADPRSAPVIDYTIETRILYSNFTRQEILRTKSLDVLNYWSRERTIISDKVPWANPESESTPPTLPSWVPNFSHPLCSQPQRVGSVAVEGRWVSLPLLTEQFPKISSASDSSALRLRLCGLQLGTIRRIYSELDSVEDDAMGIFNSAEQIFAENKKILSAESVYGNNRVWEEYWRTRCCDLVMTGNNMFTAERLNHNKHPEEYEILLSKPRSLETSRRLKFRTALRQLVRRKEEKSLDLVKQNRFREHVYYMNHMSVFATTKNGHFAMAAMSAQEGDVICALYGGSTPYVLRAAGETAEGEKAWELVGTAYMHGFMDLEPLRMRDEGLLKEEEFVLI